MLDCELAREVVQIGEVNAVRGRLCGGSKINRREELDET